MTAPSSRAESIDTEFRTVFVLGTISAAREAGFALPEVSPAILGFFIRYALRVGGVGMG